MSATEPVNVPRFVVAQTGARRSYAVPLILEQAGMLERFYTDVCGNVGWGKWLVRLARFAGGMGGKLRGLANRRVPAALVEHTVTFAWPNIDWAIRSLGALRDPTQRFRLKLRLFTELSKAAAGRGFGRATHLYGMLGEFTPLMRAARARGIKVVSEIYILMSSQRLQEEERQRFPEWERVAPDWDGVTRAAGWEGAPVGDCDYYLCPSEAVAADLVERWGVAASATVVVPYGMNASWLELEPRPCPGRILFVGTADLRKGIHYLAMAAEELAKRGRRYEFRVAGNVSTEVLRQPACAHLSFLGRVPRDRIRDEFQMADVFVLPSLAEGSAEVTYEALASGVPLVVTKAAGSVARDGVEGRIIPERDPVALADAIEQLVEDRTLRDQLGQAARRRAREFTWEQYGTRLVAALQNMRS
ncbi:MAG: glycosyltransferase family 4 protein [Prosthecobacter sp.]|uniref:glycosyltransferase family 4 protein n=1 Tax=Prosthecobacter sp. TaxID=1965333 RepID=UPI0019F50189|nr:glycosyltransferase family 4 protein [Prosthecobacter sp.]MBE2286882.1 glycosyltransferase family 4 protein [Prosthecobacter sp.]